MGTSSSHAEIEADFVEQAHGLHPRPLMCYRCQTRMLLKAPIGLVIYTLTRVFVWEGMPLLIRTPTPTPSPDRQDASPRSSPDRQDDGAPGCSAVDNRRGRDAQSSPE